MHVLPLFMTLYTITSDDCLNLDTLLIQLRSQVTPKWYEFGQAVGINNTILDRCLGYPPEECVVEVLDNWLRTSKRTWKDVAKGLSTIGLNTLAGNILKVYDTGTMHSRSVVHMQCLNCNTCRKATSD